MTNVTLRFPDDMSDEEIRVRLARMDQPGEVQALEQRMQVQQSEIAQLFVKYEMMRDLNGALENQIAKLAELVNTLAGEVENRALDSEFVEVTGVLETCVNELEKTQTDAIRNLKMRTTKHMNAINGVREAMAQLQACFERNKENIDKLNSLALIGQNDD